MAEILGHIDCPACGTKGGMRVTPDKNGDPFGFCEANCAAQLRIGGNPHRVAAFRRLYPWAGPVTGTVPAPAPAAAPEVKPEPKPAPKPEPEKRKRAPFGLEQLLGGA